MRPTFHLEYVPQMAYIEATRRTDMNLSAQEAWLAAHPERDLEWLRKQLRQGFGVHHADGNQANNDPDNVMLIEQADHYRLQARGILATPVANPKPIGKGTVPAPRPPMTPAALLAWREHMGYSQRDASVALGCSRMAYGGWELGKHQIPAYIELACDALALGMREPLGTLPEEVG